MEHLTLDYLKIYFLKHYLFSNIVRIFYYTIQLLHNILWILKQMGFKHY